MRWPGLLRVMLGESLACNAISKTRRSLLNLAQDGHRSVTILWWNKNAIGRRILRAIRVGGNACPRQCLLRVPDTVSSDSPNLNALRRRKLRGDGWSVLAASNSRRNH